MSQHDFRQAVAVGLIGDTSTCEETYSDDEEPPSRKRRRSFMDRINEEGKNVPMVTTVRGSQIRNSSSEKMTRAFNLGVHRLEKLDKYPGSNYRCQLCYWAKGKGGADVRCTYCKKTLCLDCWGVWHSKEKLPRHHKKK